MANNEKTGSSSQGGKRQLHTKVKTARGRKRSSTKWLQRQLNDPFVSKAKDAGYRSRAAYKIIEVDEKFNIFKNNQVVIDLGAAPGGWTQVAVQRVSNGKVIGIDLQEIEPIVGSTLLQGDFTEDESIALLDEQLNGQKADIVLSDMAAAACGHTQTDHIRIMALCEVALDFAIDNLKESGSFVAKILQGGAEKELLDLLKKNFKTVKHFKPKSSRKDSSEMYVVALDFKKCHFK